MTAPIVGPSQNRERGERRTGQAKLQLAEAYHAVFRGRPSDAQRDMVLVDLANVSGYYRVSPPGLSHDERAYSEGARSVFGRIVAHLDMTDEERSALSQSSRHEALIDQIEGEL